MSWNTTIAVVEGAQPAELERAGLQPREGSVLADFALGGRPDDVGHPGAVFAGSVPGGTVVLGDLMDVLELAPTLAPALGRTVRLAVFGGTSDSYLWQVITPEGPVRELRSQSGETDADDGQPDPAEAASGLGVLSEDTLIALLERTTGVTFDDALLETPTTPYVRFGPDTAPSGPSAAPGLTASAPRRRSLLDRILGRG
ncbi:hypothetical protein ACPYO6_16340 [Georgenia sp. Z1344]|uniref:hypothetical protein n=1 Tax=Georgenia sp. Z1344 TaxID=3416706 RepID=UPI003CF58D82